MNFSGKSKVDLQGLISFRQKLRTRIQQVSEQEEATRRALEVVSQSWEDGNFKDFESNFSHDMIRIKKLLDELYRFDNPVLKNFQAILEEYLRIRYNR